MKRKEFQLLIQKFGFEDITKNEIVGYNKRLQNDEKNVEIRKKFKYKQCYITLENGDIQIAFNNPPYSFNSTEITLSEVISLFYYLTITSNKKFAVKKENPDICKIYDKLELQSLTIDSKPYVEKKRYNLDMIEFNKIKKFISE
ncbi:MAG TPA: hypothetical protein VFC36_08575 [Paludibacter sp.]|jgi:hypothetical protein|nr:hypothetical protein [Paludibacter sp.]